MKPQAWLSGVLTGFVFLAATGAEARAQWGYGWGAYGGYGAGGATAQGDIARGLGTLAVGAGQYNEATAAARSVNADTAMRWNQFVYQSQQEANRKQQERMARRQYGNIQAREKIADRLRNAPEQRDIDSGDALNVALDEVNAPNVYTRALASAKAKVGPETIRDIPFQYAAAAISTSIHQVVTKGSAPAPLKTAEFADLRKQLQTVAASIREKTDAGEAPEAADVDKAVALIDAAEAKVATVYPANSRERDDSMKYLKALRGLLRMMETPAVDLLLAGVEKRPEASLGDLLKFMNAFNLRFGPATTARQRAAYAKLYPMLARLRSDVSPGGPPAAPAPGDVAAVPAEVFSGMSPADLRRKAAPRP